MDRGGDPRGSLTLVVQVLAPQATVSLEHGENAEIFSGDAVDHPVRLQEDLAHVFTLNFRYNPTAERRPCCALGAFDETTNPPSCRLPIVLGDVAENLDEVVSRAPSKSRPRDRTQLFFERFFQGFRVHRPPRRVVGQALSDRSKEADTVGLSFLFGWLDRRGCGLHAGRLAHSAGSNNPRVNPRLPRFTCRAKCLEMRR